MMTYKYPLVQFDPAKFKAVVHYVSARCRPEELGAVKMHKTLYFADMLYYVNSGNPLTGSSYRKRPFGPTSDQLAAGIRELEDEGKIDVREANYFGYMKKEYISLCDPDISRLNELEIALIDDVIEFVCRNNTAKAISEFSHNRAWELAEFGEELPYYSAFLMFPTEVSKEALDWAVKEAKSLETAKSEGRTLGDLSFADFRDRVLQARGTTS